MLNAFARYPGETPQIHVMFFKHTTSVFELVFFHAARQHDTQIILVKQASCTLGLSASLN